MKKLFTLMVVVAAMAMVGCCGNKAKKAEAEAAAVECCEEKECCGECEGECCAEGETAEAEGEAAETTEAAE